MWRIDGINNRACKALLQQAVGPCGADVVGERMALIFAHACAPTTGDRARGAYVVGVRMALIFAYACAPTAGEWTEGVDAVGVRMALILRMPALLRQATEPWVRTLSAITWH